MYQGGYKRGMHDGNYLNIQTRKYTVPYEITKK